MLRGRLAHLPRTEPPPEEVGIGREAKEVRVGATGAGPVSLFLVTKLHNLH